MPSSIGHMLAGFAISDLRTDRREGRLARERWPYVLLAAAPDLDVVADILLGKPIDYQRRRSHSLGAALAAGVCSGLLSRVSGGRFLTTTIRGAATYSSHLLLDYFGKDAEDGLPLFWPLSERRFAAHRPLFQTIYTRRGHFLTGLMTRRNLKKVGREIAIIAPLLLAVNMLNRGRRRRAFALTGLLINSASQGRTPRGSVRRYGPKKGTSRGETRLS